MHRPSRASSSTVILATLVAGALAWSAVGHATGPASALSEASSEASRQTATGDRCAEQAQNPANVLYRDRAGVDYRDQGAGRTEVRSFTFDGTSWTTFTPPSTFDPTRATAEELAAAGFAPRPSGGQQLEDWLAAYSSYKGVPAGAGFCGALSGLSMAGNNDVRVSAR